MRTKREIDDMYEVVEKLKEEISSIDVHTGMKDYFRGALDTMCWTLEEPANQYKYGQMRLRKIKG